jgi:hypothetical protein
MKYNKLTIRYSLFFNYNRTADKLIKNKKKKSICMCVCARVYIVIKYCNSYVCEKICKVNSRLGIKNEIVKNIIEINKPKFSNRSKCSTRSNNTQLTNIYTVKVVLIYVNDRRISSRINKRL